MSTIRLFEVGGCVRDHFLGVPTKDVDFAVEAASFDVMHDALVDLGVRFFQVLPDTLTLRGKLPAGHPMIRRTADVDFVLCRKDGPTFDGRRPKFVEPGSILDDLARRDFTVNAMAFTDEGELLDPHDGRTDLDARLLRTVGTPHERFAEDALRAVRAIRFAVTKGFTLHADVLDALHADWLPPLLAADGPVSSNRIRDELFKAFAFDTLATLELLLTLPADLRAALIRPGLTFKVTLT